MTDPYAPPDWTHDATMRHRFRGGVLVEEWEHAWDCTRCAHLQAHPDELPELMATPAVDWNDLHRFADRQEHRPPFPDHSVPTSKRPAHLGWRFVYRRRHGHA